MWDYRARVTRVIDGDTVEATLDLGFSLTIDIRVRLLGAFAPEHNQEGGPETTAFTKGWVTSREVSEWPFIVTTSRIKSGDHEVMSFDRYVATVTALNTNESLNIAVTQFVADNGYGGGIGA